MPTRGPLLTRLAEQARSNLALKLGVSADQITLSSAEAVTWPDSSLGCPQPGMAYSQIITPGYRIVLEAGGKLYEYHAGRDGQGFLCEHPRPPVPGTPANT